MIELPPELPWRIGSSLGRTLYVQRGADPSKSDRFIGVMDTPELADIVVRTRAALTELVRLYDRASDDVVRTAKIEAWREARRVLAHWIRLPDDV